MHESSPSGRSDEAAAWLREMPLAHRGLHGDVAGRVGVSPVPENSVTAFDLACRAGVGIELDVRMTLDGVPVVSHDQSLRRVTGHTFAVSELTADVLTGLHLLGGDDTVPTLQQALDTIAGRVPVMVEVKNETHRVGPGESRIAPLLAAYDGPQVIASFNPRTVRWFERHLPSVPRVLTGGASDVVPRLGRPLLRWLLGRHTGSPVGLSWNVQRLDDPIVVAAREAGMPVTSWTVRTLDDLAKARAGADGLIFEGLTPDQVR